ncbi:hypothetical protein RhiXN_10121 [Rhizoctonia solani]|uniref:MACPF-like domain-containing protein n=1 Tax=Rhizoctonia solani TaxID=456999 RepID=A0A8H8P3R9_9AGAM|nr:uncharacterized protein RhiXN_10121 [Rhizoctonia solani]QRW23797.1 hypothetical protein RhiXN_10121 [Rhizoctonia solani]
MSDNSQEPKESGPGASNPTEQPETPIEQPKAPVEQQDKPPAPASPSATKQPTTLLVQKGDSAESMKSLVMLRVPGDIKVLSELRDMLKRFKYMSSTDSFLHPNKFPIHKEDETTIAWKAVTTTSPAKTPAGSDEPSDSAPGDKKEEDPPQKSEQPKIMIISSSSEGSKPAKVSLPKFPETRSPGGPGDQPEPEEVEIPQAKAADGPPVNAKTLTKEQLDELFETNNVFGGVSFTGPSGSTSRIFESPDDLSRYIWADDGSRLDILRTRYESQSYMFKQGVYTGSLGLSTEWLNLKAKVTGSSSTEETYSQTSVFVTGVYRYPRASIRLPIALMQPTQKFKNELAAALSETGDKVLQAQRLRDFFREYGHAFASELHLGGHLHTTLTSQATDSKKIEEAEQSIRAGLSFPFGLGLGGGHKSVKKESEEESSSSSKLIVEAVGGDTLLTSNLTLWPASVMPHTNWRITERNGLQLLINILSLFSTIQRAQVIHILELNENPSPMVPFDRGLTLEATIKGILGGMPPEEAKKMLTSIQTGLEQEPKV